jgi:HD-like signal output (HDOD) protein
MLAARIMKLANSALYAGSYPVRTIRDAVVRFGLSSMRDMVMLVAADMRVFRAQGYEAVMERLRRHCTTTAHYARIVAQYTSLEAEYAFLCGLLHDIGIAALLIALCEEAGRSRSLPEIGPLWPNIATVHEHVGGVLSRLWGLPADLALVVGNHHSITVGGHRHPIVAILRIAEHFAIENGFGIIPSPASTPALAQASNAIFETADDSELQAACRVIDIQPLNLHAIRKEIEQFEKKAAGNA